MFSFLSKFISSKSSTSSSKDTNMLNEIYEQVSIITNLINLYLSSSNSVKIDIPDNIYKFAFIASGSSYHSATIASKYFRTYLHCDAQSYYASEFYLNEETRVDNKTLYVFISQSGETRDTNNCLDIISKQTDNTLSITNAPNSSLDKKAKYKILVHAGEEKSIASTKALSAQIFCLFLIALKLLEKEKILSLSIHEELLEIPSIIQNVFEQEKKIKNFAKKISNYDNIAVLASGMFYPLGKEGALKIKETSYINANAYPTGEFLHGHIALLNKKSAVISIMNNKNVDFTVNVLKKIKMDYTAESLIISALPFNDKNNDNLIEIYTRKEISFLFGSLVTLQLIAYYTAIYLGLDVDSPLGLTKIVK